MSFRQGFYTPIKLEKENSILNKNVHTNDKYSLKHNEHAWTYFDV